MKTKSICHKIITSPLRALIKARDLYVSSITSCGNKQNFGFGAAVLGPMPESNIGRSFSVNSLNSYRGSDDEDLRELIRAASTGTLANRTDEDLRELIRAASTGTLTNRLDVRSFFPEQRIRSQPYKLPPRSSSVAMGRIDEDNPSLFGELEKVNVKRELAEALPKSRSYAEYIKED